MIEFLFLDLDDTILDFHKAERIALSGTIRSFGIEPTEEVTCMVHSREDYEAAVEASNILFGKATKEGLAKLDEATLLDVFAGVPQYEVSRELLKGEGIKAVDLLAGETSCFPSKGEMRKLTQGGGVSINKEKLTAFAQSLTEADLPNDKCILAQQRNKKYCLIIVK